MNNSSQPRPEFSNLSYSKDDDVRILNAKPKDYATIASHLGRTPSAIAKRKSKLNQQLQKRIASETASINFIPSIKVGDLSRNNQPYSDAEKEIILKTPSNVMAGLIIGRTPIAIAYKRQELIANGHKSVPVVIMHKKQAVKALRAMGYFKKVQPAAAIVSQPVVAQKEKIRIIDDVVVSPIPAKHAVAHVAPGSTQPLMSVEINGQTIFFDSKTTSIKIDGSVISFDTSKKEK